MFGIVVIFAVIVTGTVSSLQKIRQPGSQYGVLQRRDRLPHEDEAALAQSVIMRELTNLADLDRLSSYVIASDDSPGFISFNINPYLQHYSSSSPDGHWEPDTSDVSQEYTRDSRSRYFPDTITWPVINDKDKRRYVHRGNSIGVVTRYKMRMFPYSNVVRLSSGCTGTLLTPLHVLTAAHCVHDGLNFKHNIGMLKLEVPDKVGYRIHYIVKINVPVMWMKTQNLPEIGKGAYDYAVLQLYLPVGGRRHFMELSIPDVKTFNSDLQFIGLVSGHQNAMRSTVCDSDKNIVIMRRNVVLTECDSSLGNSGAAAFSDNARDGPKIVGVLSNTITMSPGPSRTGVARYSAFMLLTLAKCLDICAMIYPEGEKYDVCAAVKKANREYLRVGTNRIMPFFG